MFGVNAKRVDTHWSMRAGVTTNHILVNTNLSDNEFNSIICLDFIFLGKYH